MSILDSLPDEPEKDQSSESQSPRNQRLDKQEQLNPDGSPLNSGNHNRPQPPQLKVDAPLRMVETAFLASTASLIWFINFYFPLGPVLRIFFPVPIALVYLRWGKRAAWMAAVTSGLLLSVLMGPVRSLLFVMPYAFMGVLLGATWYRRVPWIVSISLGTILGTLGFFFRMWLLSVLSSEDLWIYVINQVTEITEWIFLQLEILASPSVFLIQTGAIALIVLNNFIYLFVVHLAAWLLLDRLGNPIPRPPQWVQVLMDYEG
ncbi:YybS family protein [Nostoc sp. CENA67]|uniref:YybS family protein n=1 Tax=Amazonocrinis nigriterrae CENA67 TaxID=2794033 RepID=A0A8J7L8D6_9NOST|nr:YybS family protein [Amazonocrinis nigriterrae]MBH8564364.1 YybS family protein [Amazonocrinis nigriterrae CENA67]